jgi:hypothetical protein
MPRLLLLFLVLFVAAPALAAPFAWTDPQPVDGETWEEDHVDNIKNAFNALSTCAMLGSTSGQWPPTCAATASDARTALGLVIGTNVQAFDTDLTDIAALTTTSHGRGLLDDTNAADSRASIGVIIGTNVQAYDADLGVFGALASTGFPARTASDTWALRSFDNSGRISWTDPAGIAGNPVADIVDDSVGAEELEVQFEAETCQWNFAADSTGDAADNFFKCSVPNPGTLLRVHCHTSANNIELRIFERTEASPNSGGSTTNVLSADLLCDTDGASTTSFSDASIAADAVLVLGFDAETLVEDDAVHVSIEYGVQ